MKIVVNTKNDCVKSVTIEYTPIEALVINHAMRRYSSDEDVNEKDRQIMNQMLEVEPTFSETKGQI